MPKIKALIVDDEPLAREGIHAFLRDDREIEIVGECSNGLQAVAAIKQKQPDLVFLDIEMPHMDGFQVLGQLDEQHAPLIIFVTAYDRYAIDAFERHALDYLLKPVDEKRFRKALQRTKQQLEKNRATALSERLLALMHDYQSDRPPPDQSGPPAQKKFLRRLMIKSSGRIYFLRTEEIDWVEAADQYVLLHAGHDAHLMRESMQCLEGKLNPAQFVRIHRSTIVNVDQVQELQPFHKGDYIVILLDGTKLKLSRNRRDKLKQLCGDAL